MVGLEMVEQENDISELRRLIEKHCELTGSNTAKHILENWDETLRKFVKIMPHDYKRVLLERKNKEYQGATELNG